MLRKCTLCLAGFLLAFVGASCAPSDDAGRPPTSEISTDNGGRDKVRRPAPLQDLPKHLRDRIDATLESVHRRRLSKTNGFWTIFHGILGMGPEQTELLDRTTNTRYKAIDYIRDGRHVVRGLEFVRMGEAGWEVQTQPGTGVGQGHQDQFVAEMTQWSMPLDKEFTFEDKKFTFADFARYSKARASIKAKQELSWAILIIGQYYGTDITWVNEAGEKIAFEDMVRYELNQPIVDTDKVDNHPPACGGTHRLFGLTWVYHRHLAKGGQKTGVWRDVADKIDHYKKQARQFQNPDGAFSTNYLSGPGNVQDVPLRIGTTGHVLEWLALALTKEELAEAWVQEAVNALVMMILDSRTDPVEGGALYHAVHGLYIYRARVFGVSAPGLLIP
jgi:hypothetical protein